MMRQAEALTSARIAWNNSGAVEYGACGASDTRPPAAALASRERSISAPSRSLKPSSS